MNLVVLTGRLCADPEIRQSANGTMTIASFRLAVDRRIKKEGEPTADFLTCKAFGKTADFFQNWTRKGTKVNITGHIQTGSYTNQQGTKVYTTDIMVDSVEFGESKSEAAEQAEADRTQPRPPAPSNDGFMNIPDGVEDFGLPFN